ncbi:unnamed protein product [Prorocentrum cordatum]|uniref:Uncharacterized protein n=1 Tax=Prorocentrum cordatum TaxID=2364126 RepID=A0ABN9V4C3_9DINO|nr:unnamed protein product [Polarella glacialis]
MLCGAPGGKVLQRMGGFEHSQGFKLTDEMMEVLNMGGGKPFEVFRKAMADGMLAVRAHADELLALLQLSTLGTENSSQRCFTHPRGFPEAVLEDVCERLTLPGCPGPGRPRPAPRRQRRLEDDGLGSGVQGMDRQDDRRLHWALAFATV